MNVRQRAKYRRGLLRRNDQDGIEALRIVPRPDRHSLGNVRQHSAQASAPNSPSDKLMADMFIQYLEKSQGDAVHMQTEQISSSQTGHSYLVLGRNDELLHPALRGPPQALFSPSSTHIDPVLPRDVRPVSRTHLV